MSSFANDEHFLTHKEIVGSCEPIKWHIGSYRTTESFSESEITVKIDAFSDDLCKEYEKTTSIQLYKYTIKHFTDFNKTLKISVTPLDEGYYVSPAFTKSGEYTYIQKRNKIIMESFNEPSIQKTFLIK